MTITRLIVVLCILCFCAACVAPEPVAPADKLARRNAYYYEKAQIHFKNGCYPKARSYFEDAHERYAAADDTTGMAHSLNGIANVYLRIGDHESALLLFDETIAAYERIGSTHGLIRALCNKAAILIQADRLTEAAALIDQADTRSADGRELAALRMKTRALLLIRQGDAAGARNLLLNALAHTEAIDSGIRADIFFALGHLDLGDKPQQACDHFSQALALDQSDQAYAQVAKDLKGLGICHSALGMHDKALDYFKRSAKIYALNGDRDQIDQIIPEMEQSAQETGADIQVVKHYIRKWLVGDTEADLCD